MTEKKEEKTILRLKFNKNDKEQEHKTNLNNPTPNPIDIEEELANKRFKIASIKTQEVQKSENNQLLGGLPKIITNSPQSFNKKPNNFNTPFRKKTFIPKNENKFAPKPTKKEPFNKSCPQNNKNKLPYKPKEEFSNNFALDSAFKPKPNINKEYSNKNSTKIDLKRKKPIKKESFKSKTEEIPQLTGRTFIGRIEQNTLEEPEFIKLKKFKKKSIQEEPRIFEKKHIKLTQDASLKDISNQLAIKTQELFEQARIACISFENETELINIDLLELLLNNMGHTVTRVDNIEKNKLSIFNINLDEKKINPRIPIVSIVGHIDHGKTSLIEYISKSHLTNKELGGITQSTKAYTINTKHGAMTLIDTPGHAAFSKMIKRNINLNDISILIISGVDGVQSQTIDAIKILKTTKKPFVIALTKQDMPSFNTEIIKQQLAQNDILVKDYGGEIELIAISSKTGHNIDLLLETIVLYGQILNLTSNNEAKAVGFVLESKSDPKTGIVCDLLIKNGNLKIGDIVVTNSTYGKIKRIINTEKKQIKQAFAGDVVEVLGLSESPIPGEKFGIAENNAHAIEIIEYLNNLTATNNINLNHILSNKKPILNLILKADSQGTLEALKDGLESLDTTYSTFQIINETIGKIKESDLELAKISNATILAFNVKADQNAQNIAKSNNTKIIESQIIYQIIDNIQEELTNIIKLIPKEIYMGSALIQMIFKASKIGHIAGCIVKDGKIIKNSIAKVFRKDKLVYEGPLKSLKRFKNDAKEVSKDAECGILLDFNEIHIEDIIKCYMIEYVKPE